MSHRLAISRADIQRAERLAHRALRRDPDVGKGKAGKMHALKEMAEVLGPAFLTGVVKGKYGPVSLGPVPADALAGLVLMGAAGFFGFGGKYATDIFNIGLGVGAGYMHTLGAGVGLNMNAQTPSKTSGVAGSLGRGSAPLTEAELAAMARAVR